MKKLLAIALIALSFVGCGHGDVRKAAINIHQDTARKLFALEDIDILNFIYGECFPGRTLCDGKIAHAEYLRGGADGDSLYMKCEQKIFFREGTDSLCYVIVGGNMYDSLGHMMRKQYSMLLKLRRNYWKLASPASWDTIIDPETFSDVEYFGPYVLLRFRKASIYSGAYISADDKYLCIYKGKLFPRGNYPEDNTGNEVKSLCNYHPAHNQGILKVSYNDSLKAMEYYFYGVKSGLAKTEKNICCSDTAFNVVSINNHNDLPDTLNFIPEEKLKRILANISNVKR